MSMHKPAHPGEILRELIIEPLELTVTAVDILPIPAYYFLYI